MPCECSFIDHGKVKISVKLQKVYRKKIRKRIGPLSTFKERGYVWNERRKTQVFGAFRWNMSVSPWLLTFINLSRIFIKQNLPIQRKTAYFPRLVVNLFKIRIVIAATMCCSTLYTISQNHFPLYSYLFYSMSVDIVSRSSDFLRQVACVVSV